MMIVQLGAAFHQSLFIQDCIDLGYPVVTLDNRPSNYGHSIASSSINRSITDTNFLNSYFVSENTIFSPYGSDVAMLSWLQLNRNQIAFKHLSDLCKKDTSRKFLQSCFSNHDLHLQPNIYLCNEKAELSYLQLTDRIIVKPNISSGSKGVTIVNDIYEAEKVFDTASTYSIDKRVVLEEFVPNNGLKFFGEGFKIKQEVYFVFGLSTSSDSSLTLDGSILFTKENCHHFTGYEYSYLFGLLKDTFSCVFDKLNSDSTQSFAFNVDFYLIDNKVFVIEFAPRPGGNFLSLYLEYVYDIDYTSTYLSMISPMRLPELCQRKCRFMSHSFRSTPISISISKNSKPIDSIFSFPYKSLPLCQYSMSITHA